MRSSEILLQQLVAQLVDEISSTVAQRVHDRLDARTPNFKSCAIGWRCWRRKSIA
jgi:hypothetical protein